MKRKYNILTLVLCVALGGCGSSSGGGSSTQGSNTPPVTYTVGGTISGLTGSGLVLQDNGGNNLAVSANRSSFAFTTAFAIGTGYSVTVMTQPTNPNQTCAVTNGSGTMSGNVTNVSVTCTTNVYTIGGTISGLTGTGLILKDNGGNNLPVSAGASTFTFTTAIASGGNYSVTVFSQPSGPAQTCVVTNGSGPVTSANITSVVVTCTTSSVNPVPLINQPLVPTTAVPGGSGFTLTINGTGFVSNSVVNWNGSSRVTTFVNGSQLKATISATDIATNGTAAITVTNPGTGGGKSNVDYFQITNPSATLSLSRGDVPAGGPVSATIAADFNGDGKLDLAFVHGGGTTVTVVLGNGDGTFQSPVTYPTGNDSTHLATGDLNGDGKLDLIVTNAADNTVSIFLGNGDGTFQTRTNFSTGTNPIAVATGDFNGDGKLDLAITDASVNTVSILLGNGDGTFQAHTDYATGIDPQSVFVGDFNGDGKLDIATANITGQSVSILIGNGNGSFQSHVDYPVGTFSQFLVGADLNGDGILDLAVANTMDSTVSVLLGKGDGSFQAHVDYATGGTPSSVTTGDFNGDGKVDLATGNCAGNSCAGLGSLSILLGNGNGTFQSHLDFSAGASESVISGDFNGDGKLDLAIDNGSNSTLSVFLQTPSVAPSNIKYVQSANFTSQATVNNPTATYTATFSSSVTTGNMIVLAFWWNYPLGGNIVSVTDSKGNSYKQALVTPPGNNDNAWIYYASNVSGGVPLSITVVVSQSTADQFSMAALEYASVSSLDVTSTNSGSMTSNNTTSTSGDAMTHQANELILGVSLSNELNTTVAGSFFTSRFTSNYFMVEDRIVSSTGTYHADFFLPTGCQFCAWQAGMATFH